MSESRIMVEFPPEEARAITGQDHDRDLEEAALRRVERALLIEEGTCGALEPHGAARGKDG